MGDSKKNNKGSIKPTVAPGTSDAKFGEKATGEDVRRGNSTRVTRVYLDENDPS